MLCNRSHSRFGNIRRFGMAIQPIRVTSEAELLTWGVWPYTRCTATGP